MLFTNFNSLCKLVLNYTLKLKYMIDLLIKLLMLLGINYGITNEGQVSLSESSLSKLQSSSEFKDEFGSEPLSAIVVVPNVDPTAEASIVVVPNVDPK